MSLYGRRLLGSVSMLAGLLAGAAPQSRATPPPAPWRVQNVGVFEEPGFADVDFAGRWVLQAFHGETGLGQDAFFFVHQPLVGDGSVLALLLGQEGGNSEWGRAGLTIMERLAVRGRGAHLSMTSGHGLAFSYRSNELRPAVAEVGERRFAPRRFPIWLRLQREGDQLTPFMSEDGFGWTQLRSPLTLWRLPREVPAGLSVASGWGGPVSGSFSTPLVSPGRVSPLVRVSTTNGTVLLGWPPVTDAVGYLVRRSATPDLPNFAADLMTPSPIRETSYVDTGLTNDAPVRYLVSAVFGSGSQAVEGWPTVVTGTPIGVPENLVGRDLSQQVPQLQGGITFDLATEEFTISGAGQGFGEREDHGYFVSRPMTGNFQATARILVKPGGMAGLMVRETLEGTSRMAFFGGIGGEGLVFRHRLQSADVARPLSPPALEDPFFRPPLYLRLVRRGNMILPLYSRDGATFRLGGQPITYNRPLPAVLHVGYAITSKNENAIAANKFRDLTIETRQ